MRWLRRVAGAMVAAALALTLALLLFAFARSRPQDLPWTALDLGEPIGLFTGRKLAALRPDFANCGGLLDRAGVRFVTLPPLAREQCGYSDGVRFIPGGARSVALAPAGLGTSCPVAAALAMWEWDVLQPAARRRFNARVVTVDHFGSYNCRRIAGSREGTWSEHATANAIDIAGFRLSDGTRITVARDWHGAGAKAGFLREVRDGACRLFATTLSPDYNAAHRDHLHLDQAPRGRLGWRACAKALARAAAPAIRRMRTVPAPPSRARPYRRQLGSAAVSTFSTQ